MSKRARRFLFSLSVTMLLVASPSWAVERVLYSVSRDSNRLRVLNPLNGTAISAVLITLPGATVVGANGLARHPLTGELFALIRTSGDPACFGNPGSRQRRLVKLNTATGVATNVGLTGDCFAGIAFHSNGTLYGVTGDGAAIRESLFTLSTATGAATFLRVLGNGTGGEVIAFNPNDALIYHASGCDICGLSVFESINPVSLVVTNIPQSGLAHKEITALTHSDGTTLLMVDLDNFLFAITTNGVVSLRGGSPLNHQAKGLAFVPRQRADFDRDVKSDLTVYRAGTWLTRRSGDGGITAVGWGGAAQDIPVLGDYDGDGKSDQAVYRDGNWLILRSSDGGVTATGWGGLAQDKPVPADYDGDGKTDIAIYRDGNWFILRSSDGGVTATGWGGLAQDKPMPADYDGDGKTDIAVYRDGNWFILRSSDGGVTATGWGGLAQDKPMPADYDGDGKTDIAVYRDGNWFILRSLDGGVTVTGWGGLAQDKPVPADYDGDGKTDIAVYRDGTWFILRSSDGGVTATGWGGLAQDMPLS